MARPRQFDEAKVKAALRDVFWKHGYEGASYADIMAATGLNKGSLYASFGDKRALYQHALSDYDCELLSPAVAMLRDQSLSSAERMKRLFNGPVEAAETREGRWGCLLCNAAVDRSPFDQDVEKTVKGSLSRFRLAITACLKGTAAEDKSDLIWTAYFGAQVMVKAGFSKAVLRKHMRQALSLLD